MNPDQNQQPQNQPTPQPGPVVPGPQPQIIMPPAGGAQPQVAPPEQQPIQSVGYPPAASQAPNPKKKRLMTMITIAIMGVALLVGGTAAAYYLAVVPNKPENVLKAALQNTAKQSQTNFESKLSFKSTEDGAAGTVEAKGGIDSQARAFQTTAEVTMSGVTIPAEVRFVDKTFYIKFGDLSSVANIAEIANNSPLATVVRKATGVLSNQWIEVDETVLARAKADCYLDISWKASDDDLQKLMAHYDTKQFATIKSTTDEQVNGKDAVKYDLAIDDNKLSEYLKDMPEVSLLQQFKKCNSNKELFDDKALKNLADDDTSPLQIWVEKDSKLITKVATQTTVMDQEKDNVQGNFETTLTYGAVKVEKPEGSKPVLEVMTTLYKAIGIPDGQMPTNLQQALPIQL